MPRCGSLASSALPLVVREPETTQLLEPTSSPSTPAGLGGALDALERDHEFLLRGDVFSQDLVESYIAYKREEEVTQLDLRPHPYEFYLYFDV